MARKVHACRVPASSLYALQQDAYHYARNVGGLADVAIVNHRPRDAAEAMLIQQTIDTALSGGFLEGFTGKSGLTIEVLNPSAEVPEANVPGPQLEAVLVLRVTENPLVNQGDEGTRLHAEDAALLLVQAFHHWHRDSLPCYADRRAIRDSELDEDGLVVFEVSIRCELGMDVLPRVQSVAVTVVVNVEPNPEPGEEAPPDNLVTLTCGTSGAAMYYTTDGSPPFGTNAEAQAYTTPFAVASGAILRAAATKAGHLPSLIMRKIIS